MKFKLYALVVIMTLVFDWLHGVDLPEDPGISELKNKLLNALTSKDINKFLDCYLIEKRFQTPEHRRSNEKTIQHLFKDGTIEIKVKEISKRELEEVMRIQETPLDVWPYAHYSLTPKKILSISLKSKDDSSSYGHRFFIGEQDGKWYIITLAGVTT
jgi:hypothetical protein